jgi:hypothetical protein
MSNLKEIKERFESLYAEWEEVIKDPHIQISSRPQDYIDNEPYRKIVNLGKDTLPFVLEKIEAGVILMNQAALEISRSSMEDVMEKEKKLTPTKRLDFAVREMPQFLSEQQKSRLILKHLKSTK